jgi:hypothetical protein
MSMVVNANGINANRTRLMYRFWLDVQKQIENDMADWLSKLYADRKGKPTIFNALRLFYDLSQGRTTVLCELFPFAVNGAAPSTLEVKLPTSRLPSAALPDIEIKRPSNGGGKQATENFFRSMALVQGLDPSVFGLGMASSTGNAKQIKGAEVEFAAPDFNDLDLL